jgi:hypothetical protein
MRVELFIKGKLFHTWHIEHAVYYEALCEVSHEEEKELWTRIIENCKQELLPIIARYPYEFYIVQPARIQPADIDPCDQEKFLELISDLNQPDYE